MTMKKYLFDHYIVIINSDIWGKTVTILFPYTTQENNNWGISVAFFVVFLGKRF